MELFNPLDYCAVLINLALPDMDGVELIRFIRKKSIETLIVVVTGAEDPRKRSQAIEAGASGFFTKPYTSEDHRLLMNQLQARQAAYQRGKKFNHWRTTLAGSANALGAFLWGSGILLAQMTDVHKTLVNWLIGIGVFVNSLAVVYGGLVGADKKSVDDQFRNESNRDN